MPQRSFSAAKQASIEAVVVHHVDIDQEIRPDRGRQRLHPLAERLALIGKRQFRPLGCQGRAMPQAMERSFATPMTSPRLPFIRSAMPCPFEVAVRPDTCSSPVWRWCRRSRSCWTGPSPASRPRAAWSRFRPGRSAGSSVGHVGRGGDEIAVHHQQRIDRLMHAGRAQASGRSAIWWRRSAAWPRARRRGGSPPPRSRRRPAVEVPWVLM